MCVWLALSKSRHLVNCRHRLDREPFSMRKGILYRDQLTIPSIQHLETKTVLIFSISSIAFLADAASMASPRPTASSTGSLATAVSKSPSITACSEAATIGDSIRLSVCISGCSLSIVWNACQQASTTFITSASFQSDFFSADLGTPVGAGKR